MSADIVGVLVVPAEGDPGGLLRVGVLGARPPVARRFVHRDLGVWESSVVEVTTLADPSRWPSQELALVLWWDDALVPEGWDRARRVPILPFGGWERDPTYPLEAEMLARRLVAGGLASRVVRLARVDGRLVEVP